MTSLNKILLAYLLTTLSVLRLRELRNLVSLINLSAYLHLSSGRRQALEGDPGPVVSGRRRHGLAAVGAGHTHVARHAPRAPGRAPGATRPRAPPLAAPLRGTHPRVQRTARPP